MGTNGRGGEKPRLPKLCHLIRPDLEESKSKDATNSFDPEKGKEKAWSLTLLVPSSDARVMRACLIGVGPKQAIHENPPHKLGVGPKYATVDDRRRYTCW